MANKKFKYQHIYSALSGKTPDNNALLVGEIAVNGFSNDEKLFIKNTNNEVVDFPRSYSIKDIDEDMEIIAAALNDLNDRKLDASAKTEVETDTEFDITSDRPLANSAITKTVEEIEKVTSAALNDLNERKLDASAYTFAADEYLFPTDAEYVSSSSTIEFTNISGDTAFSVQLPPMKASLSAGTNIHIEEGEEFDTISVSGASSITSSSTEVVQSKAIYEELDKKLDKINFINNIYPKGSVYITYEYKNPSTFIGGQWELIGGEDANKNYYPAFAISTDTAGTTINESLPNIKGSVALQSAFNNTFAAAGAFTQDTTLFEEVIDGSGARKRGTIWFNAHNSNSTYQDGAQVNVNAIKIFFWRRTDDATIVEQITPLDVDVKDVLFTGSAGGGTAEITLAHNFEDYKTLKITFLAATSWVMIRYIDTKDIKPRYLFDLNWANDAYRYCYFQGTQPSSGDKLLIDTTSDVYVTEVVGIKPVPTSDVPAIDLQTFYGTTGMTTQGSFGVNITVPSGYVPLGRGATIVCTNGAIGYGYIDAIAKNSDTSYYFGGWCNPNGTGAGASSITVAATFVKGPYVNLAKFVTAGDGINVSDTGVVSVAPLQKVTCTKTSLIGNEFYFGGEYYPALKTVHVHGGFAPTTAIGNGSGICRLTIGSQQVVFDDNVIGYVMCNNNGTYMRFCQSTNNGNQITARDLTIDTGRFYWLDLWCPAHLA